MKKEEVGSNDGQNKKPESKKKTSTPEKKAEEGLSQETIDALVEKKLQEHLKSLAKGSSEEKSSDDRLVNALEAILSKGQTPTYGENNSRNGYVQNIDKDDLLPEEETAVFYAFSFGYVIVDDKKAHGPEQVPYGLTVEFEPYLSKRKVSGKEVDVYQISRYSTRSRKVAEWLRNHSRFNIAFREAKSDEVDTRDKFEVQQAVKYINAFQNMGQDQIIRQCEANGVEVIEDLQQMKTNLALHLAHRDAKQKGLSDHNRNKIAMMEAKKELGGDAVKAALQAK